VRRASDFACQLLLLFSLDLFYFVYFILFYFILFISPGLSTGGWLAHKFFELAPFYCAHSHTRLPSAQIAIAYCTCAWSSKKWGGGEIQVGIQVVNQVGNQKQLQRVPLVNCSH